VLTVLVLLLVGVGLGQLRGLPDGAGPVLDAVVIRISLPALIVAVVAELELDPTLLVPVGAAWGSIALLALAVWGLARAARLDRRTTGTLLLVVPLSNSSFLGFPAVEALLGADHLPAAVLYDQLGMFLALSTVGAVVAARYGAGPSPAPARTLGRIVTFPPFVALVVALVANLAGGLPVVIAEVADVVGATVTPLAMLAVGLRLDLGGGGWRPGLLGGALALRMVAAPAAVYAVAVAAGGVGTIAWDVAVLETAMPPMVVASVLAADAGLDAELGSRLVGLGVLVAMVTLPAWTWLLGA
jgi:predicted permease